MNKHCADCGQTKQQSEFYRNKGRADGLAHYCMLCQQDRTRRYKAANRDVVNARQRELRAGNRSAYNEDARRRNKWSTYRIHDDAWQTLLSFQGGCCAICGTADSGKRAWHTDHDWACCPGSRSCGRCVRGLLCHDCNVGLGFVERAAAKGVAPLAGGLAEYVKRPPLRQLLDAVGSAAVLIGAAP